MTETAVAEPITIEQPHAREWPQPPPALMPVPQVPERQMIWGAMNRMLIDPSYNPERVEKAYAIAKMMLADLAVVSFNNAFSDAQREFRPAKKNRKITIRAKDSRADSAPIQETPYSDWAAQWEGVQQALNTNGLSLSFDIAGKPGDAITVTAILEHRDGHSRRVSITLPHDATGSKNAVQAMGSSIAYGKRYTGMAILNLTAEDDAADDNGEAAGGNERISKELADKILELLNGNEIPVNAFCAAMKVNTIDELPADLYDAAIKRVQKTIDKRAAEPTKF